MKAALYARVSTEEQGDNYSIPAQLSLMREFADKRAYQVVGEYVDIGYAGTTAQRPRLQQLLKDVTDKRVQVVLVKCVDRLARGVRPLSTALEVFEAHDCRLEFVEFNYDGSPVDQAMLEIQAVIGRMERDLFAERLKAGRLQKAKMGRMNPIAWAKYGYDRDPDTERFTLNEEEARWVREMFAWCLDGMSVQAIALKLNQLGVPTKLQGLGRPSKGWTRRKVQLLLNSSEYYGEGFAHKSTKNRAGKIVKRPKEEWVSFSYPPIIGEELFNQTKARMMQVNRFREPRGEKVEFLLSGLLYCRECGYRFYMRAGRSTTRLADGTLRHYDIVKRFYTCAGMANYPHLHQCRAPKAVLARTVEEVIWTTVKEGFRKPELIRRGLATVQDDTEDQRRRLGEEVAQLRKRIGGLDLEEHRLITIYRKGVIDDRQFEIHLKAAREERELWDEQLSALQRRLSDTREQIDVFERVEPLLKVLDLMDDRPIGDRRELLRALVEKIWLDRKGHLTIEAVIPEIAEPIAGEKSALPTCRSGRSR